MEWFEYVQSRNPGKAENHDAEIQFLQQVIAQRPGEGESSGIRSARSRLKITTNICSRCLLHISPEKRLTHVQPADLGAGEGGWGVGTDFQFSQQSWRRSIHQEDDGLSSEAEFMEQVKWETQRAAFNMLTTTTQPSQMKRMELQV